MSAAAYNIENEILLRIASGDEKAFKEIFERYKRPFHAAAFKMTRSATIAEEIVQEVFIRLWEKRAQVAAAENPSGYLYKILFNSVYSHFKKLASEKRMMKIAGDATPESENPIEEMLLRKENRLFLDKVISRLPPQQQQVYKLSKQDGLSREEIAAFLHISPHTVKNHLQDAVKFMRHNLNETMATFICCIVLANL